MAGGHGVFRLILLVLAFLLALVRFAARRRRGESGVNAEAGGWGSLASFFLASLVV